MRKDMLMAIAAALVLSLCFSVCGYSQTQSGSQPTTNREEIVLTTYYPTPFGDYREMRAEHMAVGQTYRTYANVCWEEGKCTDWINEEGTGGDTDLIVEGNAGIGNTYKPQKPVPNTKPGNLDVNDVWVRSSDNNAGQWISQSGKGAVQVVGTTDFVFYGPGSGWLSPPEMINVPVTINGSKVLVHVEVSAWNPCGSGWGSYRIWLIRDGTETVPLGACSNAHGGDYTALCSAQYLFSDLTPGTHTFTLEFQGVCCCVYLNNVASDPLKQAVRRMQLFEL